MDQCAVRVGRRWPLLKHALRTLDNPGMKIALAVEGTRGDVYPMLALATRLRAVGHEPVICAPVEFAEVASARGLAFRGAGSEVRSFLTRHAGLLTNRGPRGIRVQAQYLAAAIESQFATLPQATADADLILGAGVQVGASSAAELRGVPYRYVIYCPSMLPSREHPPALLGVNSRRPWLNRLLWWVMNEGISRLLAIGVNRQRAKLGLAAVRDAQAHFLSERPIVAADGLLAPVPHDSPLPTRQIAYLSDVESAPLPEKLEAFLDAGPAPVYFGFGSMTDDRPDATTRMLLDVARRAGLRALISQGWAGLGDGALPEQVMVVGSVSHANLFPRVAAVVHHGGAGTTTLAARSGVPQVVIPHAVDQYYWQDRVRALGLGPHGLSRRRLDASSLYDALMACRDNEALSERAKEVGEALRAAHSPERDVALALEHLQP